jgi:hypothetical protein
MRWYTWVAVALCGIVIPTLVFLLLKVRALEKQATRSESAHERVAASPAMPTQLVVERRIIEERPSPSPSSSSDRTPARDTQSEQQQGSAAEELATNLQVRFATDGQPTQKAVLAEGVLRKAFGEVPSTSGVTLESLQCKATTCRAEVTFRDEKADVDFGRRFVVDPGTRPDLNMAVAIPTRVTRADGSIRATMYYTDDQAGG